MNCLFSNCINSLIMPDLSKWKNYNENDINDTDDYSRLNDINNFDDYYIEYILYMIK